MYKSKLFTNKKIDAEKEFNTWIKKHPNIEITQSHCHMNDWYELDYIWILYKELDDNESCKGGIKLKYLINILTNYTCCTVYDANNQIVYRDEICDDTELCQIDDETILNRPIGSMLIENEGKNNRLLIFLK